MWIRRKKNPIVAILFALAIMSISIAHSDTITKGLIGKEDLSLKVTDNTAAETFTRATSTGSTITLTKISGGMFVWDNSYTTTIRPLHVTGNGSTSVLSNFLTGTFSGALTSATLTTSGNGTVGGNLSVSGTGTVTGALSSASISTGAGTFSGDITANGDVTGDGATIVSGMARYKMDGVSYDTATAVPSSGTWAKGDFVFNSSPTARTTIAATGAIGWVCTTAGTPGTWMAVFPVFVATPDNAAMTCTAGMVAIDNSYHYSCTATNTWRRVLHATW